MKITRVILAALFLLAAVVAVRSLGPTGTLGLIATPAVAATPPGQKMTGSLHANCAVGFTANPSTYTTAQVNSDLGMKYMCSKPIAPNVRPFPVGFKFACSAKFSAMGKDSGADAPGVENGNARYFCITGGPHTS